MLTKKRIFVLLAVASGLIITFISIAAVILAFNASHFAKEFYSQNYQLIESGDAFSLIGKLHSISSQNTVQCLRGLANEKVFFQSKTECNVGLFSKSVTINSKNESIHLYFEYRLASSIFISLCVIFSVVLCASIFVLIVTFKLQDLTFLHEQKLNQLAKRVAHDIRSPLSAINILVGIPDLGTPDARDLLKNSAQRINDIAEELLLQSAGKMARHSRIPIDLKNLVENIMEEKVIEHSGEKDILFETQFASDELVVLGNKSRLQRVLSNLINNSIEAKKVNVSLLVKVSVKKNSANLAVEVSDNGKGIPKEMLRKIGSKQVTSKTNGHGLGTAQAFELVREMNGTITYDSVENNGTKVTILLPISSKDN